MRLFYKKIDKIKYFNNNLPMEFETPNFSYWLLIVYDYDNVVA